MITVLRNVGLSLGLVLAVLAQSVSAAVSYTHLRAHETS